jgi:hypothetical protein
MKTVEINISIPVSDTVSHSPLLILRLISETLEDRFSEINDTGNEEEETVADTHGFGGNTLTLTTGDHVVEICL